MATTYKIFCGNHQYFTGAIFLFMAYDIDNLLPENGKPNILVLVYSFSALTFLSATQDIAVDGWALTMLKKWVICNDY